MAATHQLAMVALGRAAVTGSIQAIEVNSALGTKMLQTFTTQVEALAKLRRGGEQKVKVEHVHVYEGGQAIVGNVTQGEGLASKMDINPMNSLDRQPSPFRLTPRCCAKTRAGTLCLSPAVRGKMRCHKHGGAVGSGAPRGNRNGRYFHGQRTQEATAFRRQCRAALAAARETLDGLG